MNPCPRPRRSLRARLRLGLGTALTLCAALPFAASAQGATVIVPAGSGLTMPAGIAETPDGAIWVSDAALGVCQVKTSDPAGVIESPYCAPEPADELLPPRSGPSVPFQMAFDPISSNLFVAEGSSKGSGVWRMHWDAVTGTIDQAERVVIAGTSRVFGLAMGTIPDNPATIAIDPTVYVDFNGRDETLIRRLNDAGNATPIGIQAAPVVGNSGTAGVLSMTNLDGALYLAEATGVTRIAAPGPDAPLAQPVAGFPATGGAVPSALAADGANGRVYAGTNNVDGIDTVDVLTPGNGTTGSYETGFALVVGIAVRANGDLIIGDDPLTSAGAPESLGQSRLSLAPLHAPFLAPTTITSAPDVYSSATAATFSFHSTASANFACRLDGSGFAPCDAPGGPDGSQSYAGLADGVHAFEVRAAPDSQPARYTFIVDTVAPAAQVDNLASDKVTDREALRVRFSADEFGVSYACKLDGAVVHACEPPVWLRGFALGNHTFTATPTDLAGNVGTTVVWTFERIAPPPAPEPPRDNSGPGSTPGPDASGPGPAPVGDKSTASSVPTACRALAGQKAKGTYKLAGRRLTVRITPTSGATHAKLTLRPRGKAKGTVAKLAVKAVTGTKARDLRIVLTKAQAARLRRSSSMLTVSYGTCATSATGPATELKRSAR